GEPLRRHDRTVDRSRRARPRLPRPHSALRPRRPRGRAPPYTVQRVLLQRKSSCVRVLRASSRLRPRGNRRHGDQIGTNADGARESTEVSSSHGDRSGPTGTARGQTPPTSRRGPPGPHRSVAGGERRSSLTGASDGLYEDANPSRRHGHGIARTGPAPRTREGLVPATNREAGPASRSELRREVDEVRTLAVLLRRPTSHQRTAFVQDRVPPDSTDDDPRRPAGDLPNDRPRPPRLAV